MPMTDQQLEKQWPAIDWRAPQRCMMPMAQGYVCRYCIAQIGLRGTDTARVFPTEVACHDHIKQEHPHANGQ